MRKVAGCVQSDEDTVVICRYICFLLSEWNQLIGHVTQLFRGVPISHLEQTGKDQLRRKVQNFAVSIDPLRSDCSKCAEKYVDVTRRMFCRRNGFQFGVFLMRHITDVVKGKKAGSNQYFCFSGMKREKNRI